jgi:hypothetical protein
MPHEWMSEQVVEKRLGGHELIGVYEDDNQSLLTLQKLLQLFYALQIFHDYYNPLVVLCDVNGCLLGIMKPRLQFVTHSSNFRMPTCAATI